MTSDTIILISQFVILAVLIGLGLYLHFHHRYLKRVNQKAEALLMIQASEGDKAKLLEEKTDLLLESQEGGRQQSSRQHDESTHQDSKIMARMQTILLIIDKWMKNHDKDKDPPP